MISSSGFALHHLLDKRCFAKASSFDNSTKTIPARSNTNTSQTHSTRATHPKACLCGFKFRLQKKSWADLEPQVAEACWIQVLNTETSLHVLSHLKFLTQKLFTACTVSLEVLNTETIHCMYCLTWSSSHRNYSLHVLSHLNLCSTTTSTTHPQRTETHLYFTKGVCVFWGEVGEGRGGENPPKFTKEKKSCLHLLSFLFSLITECSFFSVEGLRSFFSPP